MGMYQLQIPSRASVSYIFSISLGFGLHYLQTSFTRVRARLYAIGKPKPFFISTCYREDTSEPGRRFLDALTTLSGARIQPYVHDIVVTLDYKRKSYSFRVFFKHHRMFQANQAIRTLANVDIHGDILLVSVGKKVEIRNVRGGDETKAADLAVKK